VITIEPPIYQVRGTTIFRDHENPDQFYYLPANPKLAAGLPVKIFKYRHDLTDNPLAEPTRARGAGLAQFEVGIPAPNRTRLLPDLASLAGRPNAVLSPVMFRKAQVHAIVAKGSADALIEDLVQTHNAPLVEPHHAAFMLTLSAEGATFVERAARGGDLPAGVVYEMQFLALTPSLHARVTMDYERIYDHFAASVGFTYYVSVKLDLDLQWLIEHDLIKIQITAFTDDADRERQQRLVMNLIATRVQQDFFRSGIPPKPEEGIAGPLGQMLAGLVGSSSNITSASAFFVLKAKMEVVREHKTFELTFNGRSAVELTHVSSGFLSTMLQDGTTSLVVHELELEDPFFSSLDVQVLSAIDFAEIADLQAAALHFSHGAHRKSFLFTKDTPGPFLFQVPLTNPRQDLYQWEAEYTFDPARGTGDSRVTAGPFTSRRRSVVLDPLQHFQYRRVRVLLGPIEAVLVPRVRVNLRIRNADQVTVASHEIRLHAGHAEEVWRVHLPVSAKDLRVFARVDWEDPRGEVHQGEEEEVTGASVVANGPYREIMSVAVQPGVDWTTIRTVHVEFEYRDGDHIVTQVLTFTKEQAETKTVQFPLLDRTKRTYRWRYTIVMADGTIQDGDWQMSDRTMLGPVRHRETARDVRVVWVGAAGDVLALRVDFRIAASTGDEHTLSTILVPGRDVERVVRIPLDPDGRLSYAFAVARVTAQGETPVRSGESQSEVLVVQAQ
jgi:hypothetical protein